MSTISPNEFAVRREALRKILAEKQIDLEILNVNSDLYYYTGSVQPLYLFLPAQGEPFVLARKAIDRIHQEIDPLAFEPFFSTQDLVRIIEKRGLTSTSRIGFSLDMTSYSTVTRLQRLFGQAEVVDISPDIRRLRMVKSEAEIAIQRKAGEIIAGIPDIIKSDFQPGMTELQMSAALENYLRLNGHAVLIRLRREGIETNGFGVLSSGANSLAGTKFEGICGGVGLSPAAPFGANQDVIQPGIPTIFDFGVTLEGYHVDMTRMFSWGSPSQQVLDAYQAMLTIEEAVIDSLKPGTPWEEIFAKSFKLAVELGYEEEYMGLDTEKVKFVGHGLGVELDEPPYLAPGFTDVLEEGMVVAVEPKVALRGVGIVGIEDTLVIRSTGPETLTSCSKEFIIV